MSGKKFSEAMNIVDDKYYEEAANYQRKKKAQAWGKWGALAACLCLIVIGGLGISRGWFNNSIDSQSACGHIEHNVTIWEDDVYFTCQNDGLFVYHSNSGKLEKITDEYGILTKVSSGLILFNKETGTVYAIDASSIKPLCDIEAENVIDIVSDEIYYLALKNASIMRTNLTTGKSTEILSISNGSTAKQAIMNGVLYYDSYGNDNVTVKTFNVITGTHGELFSTSTSSNNGGVGVSFKDNYIFITLEQGLFYMSYTDTEPVFLGKYFPLTGAFDYYNGSVYFVAEENGETSLISIDLQTKESNEVVSLTESNGTVRTYTEIAVFADGFYYTNPSATDGGLFYHAFDQTEEVRICTN